MPKYTRYGGQIVSEDEMNQLKAQPISNFLQFKEEPSGNYQMNYKFPEKGKFLSQRDNTVHEIKIRENMNLLFQSIAKLYFDPKGNLKTDTIDDGIVGSLADNYAINTLELSEISKGLGIPAGKRAGFEMFIEAMGKSYINQIVYGIYNHVNYGLQLYSNSLKAYEKTEHKDPEVGRYLEESYLDYEREIGDLKRLAKMNPTTETEVLGYMDCEVSSLVNQRCAELVNYDLNSPQLQNAVSTKVDMASMPEDADPNKKKAFTQHFCFTAPIQLDGKKQFLSVEMTAPPDGKVIFRNENGKSATGIYDSLEQLDSYHKEKNLVELKSYGAFTQVKEGTYNNNLLSKEDKAYIRTSESMRKLAKEHEYEHRMQELSKAMVPSRDYETLATALKSSTVNSKLRGTSENFERMKNSFEALGKEKDPDKKAELLKKLQNDAKIYLDNKEPRGDVKKEFSLSNYSRARIQFARDVYQLASAGINQKTLADKPWLENAPVNTNENAVKEENPIIAELLNVEKAARESLKDQSYYGHRIAPLEANKVNVAAIVLSKIVKEEMMHPEEDHPICDLLNSKGIVALVNSFANSKLITNAAEQLNGTFAVDGFLRNKTDEKLVSQIRKDMALKKQTESQKKEPTRNQEKTTKQKQGPSLM